MKVKSIKIRFIQEEIFNEETIYYVQVKKFGIWKYVTQSDWASTGDRIIKYATGKSPDSLLNYLRRDVYNKNSMEITEYPMIKKYFLNLNRL